MSHLKRPLLERPKIYHKQLENRVEGKAALAEGVAIDSFR